MSLMILHRLISPTCISKSLQRAISSSSVMLNSNRASISKLNRKIYTQRYQTLLVRPDGSSLVVRYDEPRRIIKVSAI